MSIKLDESDMRLLKRAEKVRVKQFKKSHKLTLFFPKGDDLKTVIWSLRCNFSDLHPLIRQLINNKRSD